MELTQTDILFDVFVGIFYLYTIAFAVYSLFNLKHRATAAAAIFVLLIGCSILYLIQTGLEVMTGHSSPVRVWDMYNVVQSVLNLAAVQLLSKHCAKNLEDAHPSIKRLPFI